MLSYRHAYHAGNFADVLKHSVLVHILNYMTQKDKSLRIIDTHAGAGGYALSGQQSIRNREIEHGLAKLWQRTDLPPLLQVYRDTVAQFNDSETLRFYPGSPLIAQRLSRAHDQLFFHELHSTDHRILKEAIGKDRRIKVIDENGFDGLRALLPPPERRALVLIDPSYEIKKDYQEVVRHLTEAYRRFPSGTYAVWYPVVSRLRIDEMERALTRSGIKNIQLFESGVAADTEELGMTASGMIVINPPWTLWKAVEETLPKLTEWLSDGAGTFRQVQLVNE